MKKACLLLLLFVTIATHSQENKVADSLIKLLPKTSSARNKEKVMQEIALAYGTDSPRGMLWYAKVAEFALQNNSNPSPYTDAIGLHYLNNQNYRLAIQYFMQALEQAERFKDPETQAITYDHISIVFDEQENIDKALYYLKKSLAINSRLKKDMAIADNYMSFGILYSKQNKIAQTETYFKKALAFYIKKNTPVKLAYAYFNLGYITKPLLPRYNYYLKAQPLWTAYDPEYSLSISNLCNMAETELLISKDEALSKQAGATPQQLLQKALDNINKAISISIKTGSKHNLMYAYEVLAKIKEDKKDFEAALHYTRLQQELKDSIFSQDSKNQIAALESDREIALRDKEIKLNKLTLNIRKKQLVVLAAGILLLCIIGGLLIRQNKIRRKTNAQLQLLNKELALANKTKTRFLSILNHDLRGPIASVINFLYLQKENLLGTAKKQELETKTITSAENLLQVMEDLLLWSKGQTENFNPVMKPVTAASLYADLQKLYTGNNVVAITFKNPHQVVFTSDEDYLKTIMRNLTGNAIKALAATAQPAVTWESWQENGHNYLSVTDNGSGGGTDTFSALYDDTKVVGINTGLGLHLIRDLAKAINCQITVTSAIGSGTTIVLKVN